MSDGIEVVVLLSGGLDSAATLGHFAAKTEDVSALFVDYGQPALVEEKRAAEHVAEHFGIEIKSLAVQGLTVRSGAIPGRNAALALLALWERGHSHGLIAMGIRDTEQFPDCGSGFLAQVNSLADLYTGGLVRVVAPLMSFTKQEVVQYAAHLGIEPSDVHSCDHPGPSPCGVCTSCREYAECL